MLESCDMYTSTYAQLHINQSKHINSKETLMTHSFTAATQSKVIPASVFIDQVKDAVKQLQRLNTHPGDAALIGFLPEQVAHLELVMARTQRKQKDWIEKDLRSITEAEASMTSAALLRMRPAIAKAKKNSLSAEELIQTLSAETDMRIARERFLTQASQPVSLRDDENILALPNSLPLPKKYSAKQAYTLTVAIESVDRVVSTVRLLLVDKILPDQIFSENDQGTRTILTLADDAVDIKLLGLCMANQVNIQVEVALCVSINGAGLSYTANLIRILNPSLAMVSVKQAMTTGSQDLF